MRISSSNLVLAAGLTVSILSAGAQTAPERTVERWGVYEITLRHQAQGNPYHAVQLSATFTNGRQNFTVPGFWDGEDIYKVRFMPPTPEVWRYETQSNAPALSGKTGSFTVTAPTAGNRGPVRVADTYYLRYEDGTPYHQFGTTSYVWTHQSEELQEQTLKTLAASPFNKIRFCVFPKSYDYNKNEPPHFAFVRRADGTFDFDQPQPEFWRHFEKRILDLQRLGIEADIILWHPYDRWGFSEMSDAQDDRYLRYCIARLAAYRNVWWSLANEYDFMTNRPQGHRGNKQWEDWDRFFGILQKEDPFGKLRGIHNGSTWYDHTKPWVTHASIQTADMNAGQSFRERYGKPVIYDECRYEGDIPQGWGNLNAKEMTQKFWQGTLSGCYVGHGETYKHPQDILWWAKGGVLHGQSPPRIQWLKDLMKQAPPFHELQPLGDGKGRFVLAKPGAYYLFYASDSKAQTIPLEGERPYKVDLLDPWEMTISPMGSASPGNYTISSAKPDLAYRFTPYAPGEALRPEAKITAFVSEGVAPLTVTFSAPAGMRAEWNFGDGTQASGQRTEHTFKESGLFTVSLKVTDLDGQSSVNFKQIIVDQKSNGPLARVGFANDESPTISFKGTAKRNVDGALHFPEGAPWGWAESENRVDALRGLRSFTIMGWVKPESLQTGSGGNRIAFCLNGNRDGFDLVCHTDGRLRLSVNEWPDNVRNDSSPGKLAVGKWTFFAVTYDAALLQDNVAWYFSEPSETLPKDLKLDRKTTYNAGAVGDDIGALAIGNFNASMRNYGLDRQFRGSIQGLQIFGSRIGGRGALTLEQIQQQIR
jgi:PKD repeat protein